MTPAVLDLRSPGFSTVAANSPVMAKRRQTAVLGFFRPLSIFSATSIAPQKPAHRF
jgi:hypothetical protein